MRRRQRLKLGEDRVTIHCFGGPLNGQYVEVPPGTKEFFALETNPLALDLGGTLIDWVYTATCLSNGEIQSYRGSKA